MGGGLACLAPGGPGRGWQCASAVGRTGACDRRSPVSVVFALELNGLADCPSPGTTSGCRRDESVGAQGPAAACFEIDREYFFLNSARGRRSESRSADSCGRRLGPDARCPGLQQFMIAKVELGARVLHRSPLRRAPVAPSAQRQDHAQRPRVISLALARMACNRTARRRMRRRLLELKSNTQIFFKPFGALPAHGASVRRFSPAIHTHTQG